MPTIQERIRKTNETKSIMIMLDLMVLEQKELIDKCRYWLNHQLNAVIGAVVFFVVTLFSFFPAELVTPMSVGGVGIAIYSTCAGFMFKKYSEKATAINSDIDKIIKDISVNRDI